MQIPSESFFRLSLLFPYAFGVLLFCVSWLFDPNTDVFAGSSPFEWIYTAVSTPIRLAAIFYLAGAIYWLIPYSLLAVILWMWSIKKDKNQISAMFMLAPPFLAILIIIYSLGLSFISENMKGAFFDLFSIEITAMMIACAVPSSILLGYVFIFFTNWIYNHAKRWGYILDEELQISGEIK